MPFWDRLDIIRLEKLSKEKDNVDRLFDLDNPFFRFVAKLVDVVWLNIIWIIFSLPVVTIGASTTAMYSVTMKMARDREGYVFQNFWKSFKENFKQATLIWIILLIVGTVLGTDIYYFSSSTSKYANLGFAVMIGLSSLALCTAEYVFPLQAQFENSVKQTIKNAFIMCVRHLPWTVLLLCIYAAVAFCVYIAAILVGVFIFGLTAFITSYIYNKIFIRYIPDDKKNEY